MLRISSANELSSVLILHDSRKPKNGHANSYTPKNSSVSFCSIDDDDDCFYIALFSALEQTHCARM